MNKSISRRKFGKAAILSGLGILSVKSISAAKSTGVSNMPSPQPLKNRLALNAYSFNAPLRSGETDLFGLLEYSAKLGFDGVDLTGYYFPGYPEPPEDKYIYAIKKRAFELGLHICGTGVRNDFCLTGKKARKDEKKLVKDWIIVAEKLGAPAIRLFAGKTVPDGYTWDETARWVADDMLECAAFGEQHGVVIEIQNHNDFLKTASEVNTLLSMTQSPWIGLMLDIGSYRQTDPYKEIEATIHHAISWQLKENVFIDGEPVPVDLEKLKSIISASEYKGYIPIETLGPGDPVIKVETFYKKVRSVFYS